MTGYLKSSKISSGSGEKSVIGRWLDIYYQLLKFTICPTRFVRVLLVLCLSVLLITSVLLWLGAPSWMMGVYVVAALIFVMPMFTLQSQMARLASCKTIALCGNTGIHLGVMATVLLVLLAFIVAPGMVNPIVDIGGYFRAVVMWISFFLLLVGLGILLGVNLFFVGFFLLMILGSDPIYHILIYWVTGNSLSLYWLLLTGLLAWLMLCSRLHRNLLKEPVYLFDINKFKSDKGWIDQWVLLKFIPSLKIDHNADRNRSVLILESGYYLRDYLCLFAMVIVPVFGIFYVLKAYGGMFEGTGYGFALALIFMLVPLMLILSGTGTFATAMRRLWLLMPGDRCVHLAYLERRLLKLMLLWLLVGLLPAGLLLYLGDQPLLWVTTFILLVAVWAFSTLYFSLLSLMLEGHWVAWARVCYGLALAAALIFELFWRDPLVSAAITILMALLTVVARSRLYYHWQRLDMSRLKFMQMNPWAMF